MPLQVGGGGHTTNYERNVKPFFGLAILRADWQPAKGIIREYRVKVKQANMFVN